MDDEMKQKITLEQIRSMRLGSSVPISVNFNLDRHLLMIIAELLVEVRNLLTPLTQNEISAHIAEMVAQFKKKK